MIVGINIPANRGNVTVFPGEVILGDREGVILIPAHLAERVVQHAELALIRDTFGFERLKAGAYTPVQIDGRSNDEIEANFSQWLRDNINDIPVPNGAIEGILTKRS